MGQVVSAGTRSRRPGSLLAGADKLLAAVSVRCFLQQRPSTCSRNQLAAPSQLRLHHVLLPAHPTRSSKTTLTLVVHWATSLFDFDFRSA